MTVLTTCIFFSSFHFAPDFRRGF